MITRSDQRAIVRAAITKSWMRQALVSLFVGVEVGLLAQGQLGLAPGVGHWVLLVIAVSLLLFALMLVGTVRRSRVACSIGARITVAALSDGLLVKRGSEETVYEWDHLGRLQRARGAVSFRVVSTWIIVPARAVSTAEFEEMRRLVEVAHRPTAEASASMSESTASGLPEEGMSNVIVITARDQWKGVRSQLKRLALLLILGFCAGAALVVIASTALAEGPTPDVCALLASGLGLWAMTAAIPVQIRIGLSRAWPVGSRHVIAITEDCLLLRQAGVRVRWSWNQIAHLAKNSGSVTFMKDGVPVLLPSRLVTPEIFAAMRSHSRISIGDARGR
ncbi:hypothetical protein [uncultured Microbacterium sp.]|uniref:hypothetical protein n=1 Tax=uncultured Microbacterium sp. TaxID=191216 RepID=UPI0028DB747B|nr:hypothetical protein [uncultured Microbacterium sp.]